MPKCYELITKGKNAGQICGDTDVRCRHTKNICPVCGEQFNRSNSYAKHISKCVIKHKPVVKRRGTEGTGVKEGTEGTEGQIMKIMNELRDLKDVVNAQQAEIKHLTMNKQLRDLKDVVDAQQAEIKHLTETELKTTDY